MPRKGGLSNILRQLTSPNPRKKSMNRFNRQPRNMNRENPIVEPQQSNREVSEPYFGIFGPEPGVGYGNGFETGFGPSFGPGLSNSEQGSQEYGLFDTFGPRPIADVNSEIDTGTENSSFENKDSGNEYSIF